MSKTFLPTILEQKEKEVAQLVMEDLQPLRQTYRLYDFLKSNQNKLQIISEVKKASPSMGDINLDVDIVAQAKTYEENGAAMISVLTDEVFFKGDISYLKEISSQVAIPTLAKDFIIDEKQIVRSRNAGATVILLIVAALPEARLKELYDFATSLAWKSWLRRIICQNWKWLIVLVLKLSALTTVIWSLLRRISIPVLKCRRISRTSLFIFLSRLFLQVRMLP